MSVPTAVSAAALALWGVVPLWALVVLAVAADFALIGVLGALGLYRLQCLVANVTVVVPSNIFFYVAYYLLTPMRLAWCQLLDMFFTRLASWGKMKPTYCQASFGGFLDACCIVFKLIIPGDKTVIELPFDTVYSAMRQYVDHDPMWTKFVAGMCHKVMPAWVGNSFLFRAVLWPIFAQATLLQWLVGPSYVALTTPGEGGSAPDVYQKIPKCSFLTRSRKYYEKTKGDSKYGDAACMNECKASVELMIGHSMLQANWSVTPNLETGQCTFCYHAPGKKRSSTDGVADIEELV